MLRGPLCLDDLRHRIAFDIKRRHADLGVVAVAFARLRKKECRYVGEMVFGGPAFEARQHRERRAAGASADFEYSGWLTEANHLGNVAYRAGKKLQWNPRTLKATNAPEADKFIRRTYRKGWSL